MMWTITDALIRRMIKKAVKNFCNDVTQPVEYKTVLKRLEKKIIIHKNLRLRSTWAWAIILNESMAEKCDVRAFNLEDKKIANKKHICLADGKKHFYILSFSPKALQYADPKDTFNVVAHEVAHLLQSVLLGESFHDKQWRSFHFSMGGDGNTFAPAIPPKAFKSKTPLKNK